MNSLRRNESEFSHFLVRIERFRATKSTTRNIKIQFVFIKVRKVSKVDSVKWEKFIRKWRMQNLHDFSDESTHYHSTTDNLNLKATSDYQQSAERLQLHFLSTWMNYVNVHLQLFNNYFLFISHFSRASSRPNIIIIHTTSNLISFPSAPFNKWVD